MLPCSPVSGSCVAACTSGSLLGREKCGFGVLWGISLSLSLSLRAFESLVPSKVELE